MVLSLTGELDVRTMRGVASPGGRLVGQGEVYAPDSASVLRQLI
jgi:hypothetical protein